MRGSLGDGDPPARRVGLNQQALAISEPTDPAEVLAERLAVGLATAWGVEQPRAVEAILEAPPQVRDHPLAAVRRI